jgi:hypothetical protein
MKIEKILQLSSAETYRQGFVEHINILIYSFHLKASKLVMLIKIFLLFSNKLLILNQLTMTALVITLLSF